MNHALKIYQEEALVALRDFWTRCAGLAGPSMPTGITQAFAEMAISRDVFSRDPYIHPHGLDTAPTVCIRIPTGGGKTFVAANACGVAKLAALHCEHPLIVWLAPSAAIVEQSILALRSKYHPCHRALVDGSSVAPGLGAVRVATVEEAMTLGPAVYAAAAVIIIATVQQFRQTTTDGRRVYAHNPELREHDVGAEKSLVNVIAKHRPLIVVDEAHNVNTKLSFETLARLNPALVLEITATPSRAADSPSNVLYAASPMVLFQENMIRLPIEVAANDNVDACLDWSIATRERLHRLAEGEHGSSTGSRMRPILLIQADATRSGQITDDETVIERKLIEDFRIPKEQIAIHTGKRRDLEGVDLLGQECPYTVVITKDALKEGWDCPWAYVLCTLRPSLTDKDAVQLVGRILRQYQAIKRPTPDLNKAYVAAKNREISTALNELKESLVRDLGYDESLAAMQVQGAQQHIPTPLTDPIVISDVQVNADRARALSSEIQSKISVDVTAGSVAITTVTSPDEDRLIAGIFDRPQDAAAFSAAARRARACLPNGTPEPLTQDALAKEKKPLRVKRLMLPGDAPGIFDLVGDEHFEPAVYRPSTSSAQIDFAPNPHLMGRGRVTIQTSRNSYQATTGIEVDAGGDDVADLIANDPTTGLAHFLRTRLTQTRFLSGDRPRWIMDLIGHLTHTKGLAIADLWADRYHLLVAAQQAIDADLEVAFRGAIQQSLFSAPSIHASDEAHDFVFLPNEYLPGNFDTEPIEWKKHYYARPAAFDSPNERACAMELDRHPHVQQWVRNLARSGYRIPRAPREGNRWFYPDFIAWLNSGQVVAIEHKGRLEQERDVIDKRNAGRFWAGHTGSLFVMTGDDARGRADFSELRSLLGS